MVPTSKDVEHAQRELAERGAIFGAQVVAFDWLLRADRPPGRAVGPGGVGGAVRADRRGGGAPLGPRRCWRPAPASRASLAPRCASPPSWSARWSSPRASPRPCGAGPATARGAPTRTRSRRSTAATATGLDAAGLRRRGPVRLARAQRAAREAPELARDAGVRLRLRRLRPAPARRAGDPVRALRRRRGRLAAVRGRAGRRSRRWPRATAACVELADEEVELEPLDDHYDPGSRAALHHLERGLFATEQPERVDPGDARARALGRRRAGRGRAGGRGGAGAAARGHAAGRRGGGVPRPRPLRLAGRAGLRGLRHPVLDRPRGAAAPDGGGAGPAGPAALRAAGGLGRRPADLAAHAGQAARAPPGRRPRGRGAPDRRRQRRGRARGVGGASAGRWTRSTAWPGPRSPAPCSTRSTRSSGGCSRRPTSARRRCSPAPSSTTRAPTGPATRRCASCGPWWPPTRRSSLSARRIHDRLAELAGEHGRGARARPGAGDQARGRAGAAVRGGVRVRAAGGRVPPGRRAGAVPARRGPPRAGQGERPAAAAARGPAASASATCSTSAPRAPSGGWC